MFKQIGLASALLLAGALPAMAQATCTAPIAPAALDATTATQAQMVAGINAVKAFIAASDTYQACLGDGLKAQKDAAAAAKQPFDPAIEKGVMAKVDDNQAQKEKVGAEINAAVGTYKKLHPG
jgi:hypothetical protein